jgi:chemotaxis receptor (MCP) glutamine deamidase CheD/CheY-like chemotaxis protein
MKDNATILIIDDSPVNVALLEATLKREGFHTVKADNGPEGRRLAGLCSPDLVLLDVMMPEESGFDTCSSLKLDPRTTNIPVIFVSTVDEIADKVRGFSLGAVDYITKPFNRQELIARVRVHVRLKQSIEKAESLIVDQGAGPKPLRVSEKSLTPVPGEGESGGKLFAKAGLRKAGDDADAVPPAYVHLRPGDYHVSKGRVIIRTVLGSCVSACLWDESERIVGMNHFLLVRKGRNKEEISRGEAGKYGEWAMQVLIDDMIEMGARLQNLKAKVFGGAYVLPSDEGDRRMCVGEANSRFVAKFLSDNAIPLVSSDLGGNAGRVIRFSSEDFSVYVKTVKGKEKVQGL